MNSFSDFPLGFCFPPRYCFYDLLLKSETVDIYVGLGSVYYVLKYDYRINKVVEHGLYSEDRNLSLSF